jgi:ASC-1-like (ASCH) protein
VVFTLPLYFTKKEAFEWLKQGKKSIEVRKGKPLQGKIAVFQSGPNILRLKILRKESGNLNEIVRSDNYKLIVPSALKIEDTINYLYRLYGDYNGIFTAYHVEPIISSNNVL